MTTTFITGDLLTGKRIQELKVIDGTWVTALNTADDLSCTVTLRNPRMKRLDLRESATPGKSFLAALDGDRVLAAGPIWDHDYDDDTRQLTLTAAGMWTYFDHRVLIPMLAGRNPADPTTDTRFMPVQADGPDVEYPWPTDTRTSLQGIAVALVAQAQAETNGNVPVILPAAIAGDSERDYRGSDLAIVGERLEQLNQVENGPDIAFPARITTAGDGIEWLMLIGTPDQPLLYSPIEQVFRMNVKRSSVSGLRVKTSGKNLANRAFASGGRRDDAVVIAVATDPLLTDNNYPALDVVDSSHSSVSQPATLQGYANELTTIGRRPMSTYSFDHRITRHPLLGSFAAGDFARLNVGEQNSYLPPGEHHGRITGLSGSVGSPKVHIDFQPVTA